MSTSAAIFPASSVDDKLWDAVAAVRAKAPLVQCVTNFVSMDIMANGLLALGASPAMVHATGELGAAVPIVGALGGAVSINIGTLDEHWVESFRQTVALCKEHGVPWVLDPVAAGFTPLRTETTLALLAIHPPALVRGNGSEILALSPEPNEAAAKEGGGISGGGGGGKGADSTQSSDAALDAAKRLSAKFKCVVCVSGAVDYVVDATQPAPSSSPPSAEAGPVVVHACPHGSEMLTKVTAAGCLVSSVIAAFVAAAQARAPASVAEAAALAFTYYGVCAELAAAESHGPGSFRVAFLDKLYSTSRESASSIAVKTTLA